MRIDDSALVCLKLRFDSQGMKFAMAGGAAVWSRLYLNFCQVWLLGLGDLSTRLELGCITGPGILLCIGPRLMLKGRFRSKPKCLRQDLDQGPVPDLGRGLNYGTKLDGSTEKKKRA